MFKMRDTLIYSKVEKTYISDRPSLKLKGNPNDVNRIPKYRKSRTCNFHLKYNFEPFRPLNHRL